MAISGHTAQEGVEKLAGLELLPYPDPYRPPFPGDVGGAVLARLDELFATTCPPDEVAALFLEPIQSDGGMIVPPPGFLARAPGPLPARTASCVVCDEVKVGLGRTGFLHAFEAEGLAPDVVTLGKGLGGGLPLSAVVGPADGDGRRRRASRSRRRPGIPVCASAGSRRAADDPGRGPAGPGGADRRATDERPATLAASHPLIGDVRGRGLAIGVDLVRDRDTREPATAETALGSSTARSSWGSSCSTWACTRTSSS